MYTGWQFDIAAPTLLGLRAPAARQDGEDVSGPVTYRVRANADGDRLPLGFPGQRLWPLTAGPAALFEDDLELPAGSWSFSDDGTAVVRLDGFKAGSWYRCVYQTSGALVGGCGLLALRDLAPWLRAEQGIRRTLLFGVSQSARALRQFLHDGLNVDEAGRTANDAFMPLIAGGRRGQFNQRFAIPGTLPSSTDELDPDTTYGSLLARAGAPGKVMAVNTSNEYWRGDAAALGTDAHPDVRVHHIAGTQHVPGYLPLLFELPALGWMWKGQHGFNAVDYRPVLRALLRQLIDWVEHNTEPEPSTAPTGDQLTTREAVLARCQSSGVATPRAESFLQPPGPVPAISADGNETCGIQLPDIAAPVGVHTGWNLRHPDIGAPTDELLLFGSTWWLDNLPALEDHLAHSKAVIDELVQHRFLLPQDIDRVTTRSEAAWNAATLATRSAQLD